MPAAPMPSSPAALPAPAAGLHPAMPRALQAVDDEAYACIGYESAQPWAWFTAPVVADAIPPPTRAPRP